MRVRVEVAAAVLAMALTGVLGSDYVCYLGVTVLLWATAALGVQFLNARANELTFGQGLAFGIGAYGYALTAADATVGRFVGSIAVGTLAAVAAGAIVGLVAFRSRATYFTLMTLCVAELVRVAISRSYDSLGGDNGIQQIAAPPFPGGERGWYFTALVAFGAVALLFGRLLGTQWGKRVDAQRQAYRRTAALGLNPAAVRWQAVVVSALPAGIAGALIAAHDGAVNPSLLTWTVSGDLIAVALLGGRSATGVALAAVLLVGGRAALTSLTDYWRAAFGGLLIIAVAVRHAQFRNDAVLERKASQPHVADPEPV
jgi:branched-chain amino acid transport system permease protein